MLKRCLVLLLSAALAAPAFAGGWGSRYHYGYGGHYGGYDGRYGGHYRHQGGGDAGTALLAGLVIGGLVGWLINEDRHYYERRAYYRADPYPPSARYYPRYREYVRVVPSPDVTVSRVDPELAGHACRMTREYTTTIEIDGEPRDAYGTKCLTADGSWVLGRPRLEPQFDSD